MFTIDVKIWASLGYKDCIFQKMMMSLPENQSKKSLKSVVFLSLHIGRSKKVSKNRVSYSQLQNLTFDLHFML